MLVTLTAGAARPLPVRATVCGLPAALSVMVSVPVLLPRALGVIVTLMLQLAPAATEVPHVLVCAKSPLLVPVIAMLLMVSAASPLLVSVTVCAALATPRSANVRLVGDKACDGQGETCQLGHKGIRAAPGRGLESAWGGREVG